MLKKWWAAFLVWYRKKFTFLIINPLSYEQIASRSIMRGNVAVLAALTFMLALLVAQLLIMYTPVQYLVPGFETEDTKRKQQEILAMLDRAERKIAEKDSFILSMQRMSGYELPDSLVARQPAKPDRQPVAAAEPAPQPAAEPAAEPAAAEPEPAAATPATVIKYVDRAEAVRVLVKPVDGIVTRGYEPASGHLAIDVGGNENSPVRAIAPGYVIFSEYSIATGYTIGVMHPDNMVSFYKHNSRLLKRPGSYVYAGEAIAVIGNSGENSTGPHLHFELWLKGVPVNPLKYLKYSGNG